MNFLYKILIIALALGIWSNLNAGDKAAVDPAADIQITEVKNKDKKSGIRVKFLIPGTKKDVWKYIGGVEYITKLFPAVKKITLIKKVSKKKFLFEYRLKSALGIEVLTVSRIADNKKFIVKWNRLKGGLKYYRGSWELKASSKYSGMVECIYSNFIDYAKWVPDELTNSISKDNAEAMVAELRKLVNKKHVN